jgi:hypothetical protein
LEFVGPVLQWGFSKALLKILTLFMQSYGAMDAHGFKKYRGRIHKVFFKVLGEGLMVFH